VSDELRPFGGLDSKCPKCLHPALTTHWTNEDEVEALARGCGVCGFTWLEKPADAGPPLLDVSLLPRKYRGMDFNQKNVNSIVPHMSLQGIRERFNISNDYDITLDWLARHTERDLRFARGVGDVAIRVIQHWLAAHGLKLKTE
jgi:hypothetical protein